MESAYSKQSVEQAHAHVYFEVREIKNFRFALQFQTVLIHLSYLVQALFICSTPLMEGRPVISISGDVRLEPNSER